MRTNSVVTVRVTARNLDEVAARSRITLLQFWPYAALPRMHCQTVFEQSSAYHRDVVFGKVDVDTEATLVARFSICSFPTLLVMRDAEPIGRMIGAPASAKLYRQRIDALIHQAWAQTDQAAIPVGRDSAADIEATCHTVPARPLSTPMMARLMRPALVPTPVVPVIQPPGHDLQLDRAVSADRSPLYRIASLVVRPDKTIAPDRKQDSEVGFQPVAATLAALTEATASLEGQAGNSPGRERSSASPR